MINFYLKEFKNNKKSHDKVEFDILFTCYTPSIVKRIRKKLKKIFQKEIDRIILSLRLLQIILLKIIIKIST